MARPRKIDAPDLGHPIDLTAGAIERLTCPAGKTQAFLRDSKAPGLRVRVTTAGAKSFVFEAKLNRQNIRRTIGDVRAWSIEQARQEANRLRVTMDSGNDPREIQRQQQAEQAERKALEAAQSTTLAEAWAAYINARKPKWSDSHYRDHYRYAQAGGEPVKRGKGTTQPGPLYPLMGMKLKDLTAEHIQEWAEKESGTRPTVTRNAWRLLRAFLTWCSEHADYAAAVPHTNPAKARKVKEVLGKPGVKRDALQREQLPAWFAAVRNLSNPTVAAYLQTLLLTGARPGEILALRWEHVNTRWRGLTICDKVEGERTIPLTPYVAHLLAALPRRNKWVFASPTVKDAHLTEPNHANDRACKVAGIEGLTLHGLRRSLKSLTEWLETPAGVVAQIMGHKPSATAEKHYTVRPLDLLRVHHERIEAWILEQAQVPFVPDRATGNLHAVK